MKIKICQISVRDLIEWLSTGWADWAGSVGFGWTWPLDPKTKACWATLEQSEWFSCMGSPATPPPLCPIWLMVYASSPTMADWAHPLLWPGDPVPVTQTEATCCWTSWQISLFWAGATCCILSGRPLEGETTLFGWSGLARIACPLPRSAGLECVGLRVTCFLVHQVKILHSRAQVGPHVSFLVYVWHYCAVVGCYKYYLVWAKVLQLF